MTVVYWVTLAFLVSFIAAVLIGAAISHDDPKDNDR